MSLLKIKTNLKFWAIFLIYLLYIRTSSCNITLSLISWFTCVLFVRQIKAPVLLMLGGRDRRVSPHQGLELYKVLKSRASPVRYSKCSGIQKNLVFCFNCFKYCLLYTLCLTLTFCRLLWFAEDGHSLSRVDTQVNCFLNTVLWLYQHLWTRTHTQTLPINTFCTIKIQIKKNCSFAIILYIIWVTA